MERGTEIEREWERTVLGEGGKREGLLRDGKVS